MWNLEGMQVKGRYMDEVVVRGQVLSSRVAYGGEVQHTVKLDKGFTLFGGAVQREAGDNIIIENKYITQVRD
jgi:hypothetical protein